MDRQSPELIERQMAETRESLTEKVALLEQQVVGTIQSATDAVQETVKTVRSAVEDTVATVSSTFKSSVESAKEILDMRTHVREHPWPMVGGATVAGFVTGLIVFGKSNGGYVPPHTHMTGGAFTPRAEMPVAQAPRRPGWLDDILEMAGREIKTLAQEALMVASNSIKQTVATQIPQMFEGSRSESTADHNGNGVHPIRPSL